MNPLVQHVLESFNKAQTYSTTLPHEIFDLEGYSGMKTRILYNSLCSLAFPDRKTEYFEVGAWKGSTSIASLYGNPHVHGTCIDNWSQFDGPKDEFLNNLNRFGIAPDIIEADFFTWDPASLGNKIDIYLYDGPHDYDQHYEGINRIWPMLNDTAIVIVDDWNWNQVREATLKALEDVNAKVIQKFEIRHTSDGQHTPLFAGNDITTGKRCVGPAWTEFWNGCAVFVIEK
jgi:hypothetical protein